MKIVDDDGWELVDHDFVTGRTVWHYFDGANDHYRTDYPVDNLIDDNKEIRNSAEKVWTGDYHLVASVPLNVMYDPNTGLNEAFAQGDMKHVSKWLNDGDNAAWRTKEGNL